MKRSGSFGVAFALAGLLATGTATAGGDPHAGRTVAHDVCAACHMIGGAQPVEPLLNPPPPSFRSIANRPSTSADSLFAFIETTHKSLKTYKDMPAVKITDGQTRDVVSYILSLRKKP